MTSQPYGQIAFAKIQIIFRVYKGLPQIYTLFNRKTVFMVMMEARYSRVRVQRLRKNRPLFGQESGPFLVIVRI
jgi:hypothetical protein